MDKNEKTALLLSAIGEIDEELISEAASPEKSYKREYLKPLAVCAAVFLIVIASTNLLKLSTADNNSFMGGDMSNGAAGPPTGDSMNGSTGGSPGKSDILYADGATLVLLQQSGSVYTFRLTITKEQEAIDVFLCGYGTDSFGEPIFVISTTADYAELTHTPLSPPKLRVNGAEVTKIPTSPGEYSVTVDLTELDARYDWDDFFNIYPFGEIKR